MNINRFFTDVLGANLKNTRWSWGAVEPLNHRVYLRVWQDAIEGSGKSSRVHIARDKPLRRSNGFAERLAHIRLIRAGAEGFGVVCTAIDAATTESRQIASFEEQVLLRFGALIEENGDTYAEILERVAVVSLARPQTDASTLSEDLIAIARKKIDSTTKVALVNARVGQGFFRLQVLTAWDSRCAVSGSATLDAIRASHIKP